MASRRLLTSSIIGRGRVPSSFRYSNHLKSFHIQHSTLAASSGPSVPSGAERTVSIQLVLKSALPERDADSLLNSGEPTRWMNVLMQSSAKRSTSISTYYEKSLAKPCTVKQHARVDPVRCHRKGSYHYESPTAQGFRLQLQRIKSALQILKRSFHYESPAVPGFRRQLERIKSAPQMLKRNGSALQMLKRQLKRIKSALQMLKRQLKRIGSALQILKLHLKRISSKVVDFIQRQLLPWVWKIVVKLLEDVLVQYLSDSVGGVDWNKLWLMLKRWMNW